MSDSGNRSKRRHAGANEIDGDNEVGATEEDESKKAKVEVLLPKELLNRPQEAHHNDHPQTSASSTASSFVFAQQMSALGIHSIHSGAMSEEDSSVASSFVHVPSNNNNGSISTPSEENKEGSLKIEQHLQISSGSGRSRGGSIQRLLNASHSSRRKNPPPAGGVDGGGFDDGDDDPRKWQTHAQALAEDIDAFLAQQDGFRAMPSFVNVPRVTRFLACAERRLRDCKTAARNHLLCRNPNVIMALKMGFCVMGQRQAARCRQKMEKLRDGDASFHLSILEDPQDAWDHWNAHVRPIEEMALSSAPEGTAANKNDNHQASNTSAEAWIVAVAPGPHQHKDLGMTVGGCHAAAAGHSITYPTRFGSPARGADRKHNFEATMVQHHRYPTILPGAALQSGGDTFSVTNVLNAQVACLPLVCLDVEVLRDDATRALVIGLKEIFADAFEKAGLVPPPLSLTYFHATAHPPSGRAWQGLWRESGKWA